MKNFLAILLASVLTTAMAGNTDVVVVDSAQTGSDAGARGVLDSENITGDNAGGDHGEAVPDGGDVSDGVRPGADLRTISSGERGGCPHPWSYTTNADFDGGTLINVNHDVPDQLRLNAESEPFPYIWVAASGRGSVVRVDTATGEVLGEYWSAPSGRGRNPSRTTVDLFGSVWAGNRNESAGGQGSVINVGLVVGGTRVDSDGTPNPTGDYLAAPFDYNTCEDRNGDGFIGSSRGLGDIRAWPNPGGVDNAGGVSSAEDECIIKYVRVGGENVRHLSVDANNNVWTGGHFGANHRFELIDGSTGAILAGFDAGVGGYGGLVDSNGILWSASRTPFGLLRYDTNGTTPTDDDSWEWLSSPNAYGLAVDANGDIWHSQYTDNQIRKFDWAGNLYAGYPKTTGGATGDRGVAVTLVDGHVWVANSHGSDVSRLDADGNVLKVIPLGGDGQMPTGVAVDQNGKVWVTCHDSSTVKRIDPDAGGDGLGEVDLTVDLGSGANPYNYSDMTGIGLLSVVEQGTWTVVHQGAPQTVWAQVNWNGQDCAAPHEPPGTSIVVEVRAADTEAGLAGQAFVEASNGGPLSGIVGTFIEVRATLNGVGGVSPVLCDLGRPTDGHAAFGPPAAVRWQL